MAARYEYKPVKVNITDYQRAKMKSAIDAGKPVVIQLKFTDLTGNDILALTQGQIEAIAKAYESNSGVRISMSKTQTEYNKTVSGGFIGALLSAALPAVIGAIAPDAISWLYKKFTGTGIIKNGDQLIKMKRLGDGLYLKPFQSDKFTTYANGLYLKPSTGGADYSKTDLNDYDVFKLFK